LGALLGRSIGEVLQLPHRELEDWGLYWKEEPWGAYRDNMHAALIIANLLRPHMEDPAKPIDLAAFMFENPEDRRERERARTALQLRARAAADAAVAARKKKE
jgi:hypothetical protein